MLSKFSAKLKKPDFKFLKNKKNFEFNKESFQNLFKDFDYKTYFNKYKNKFYEIMGNESDNSNHLATMIENMIQTRYNLKGGFSDLIANEAKYESFVRSLGYDYFDS